MIVRVWCRDQGAIDDTRLTSESRAHREARIQIDGLGTGIATPQRRQLVG